MKLDSPKQTINKSQEQVFEFLSDVKNFEKLMPENTSKFELRGDDGFVFALTGMPEIALIKKESVFPSKIVLGAAGGKLDFDLTAHINSVSEHQSEVQLTFNGEFNAMIGMMIKSPINKLIETLVSNVPNAI